MSFIKGLLGGSIAILLTLFAVLNREPTLVHYSPLHDPIEMPLYLISLGLAASGFILGALFVWFNGGKKRSQSRAQRRLIKSLEKRLENADNAQKPADEAPASELFPALTKR